MAKYQKITLLFPGQGAQYPGMGKDFFDSYPQAKETFQHADELLKESLSDIIFNGPQTVLTETKHSQTGIYVLSIALWNVVKTLFPSLAPFACAGLSLGEYTALTASKRLSFEEGLPLVQKRGRFMNEACEKYKGAMAVITGLDAEAVESIVEEVNLPRDLWAANFNCPGQVAISGTVKGIEAGSIAAKAKGAKRVIPLQVHGAFHSGLMQDAGLRMSDHIQSVPLKNSPVGMVKNVTGDFAYDEKEIRRLMVQQITSPVRWEQGIRKLDEAGTDLYIEIGCGKTLAGFNKRIGVKGKTLNIEKIADLEVLASEICP